MEDHIVGWQRKARVEDQAQVVVFLVLFPARSLNLDVSKADLDAIVDEWGRR